MPAPADPAPTDRSVAQPGGPGHATLLRRFGAWVVDWALCSLFTFLVLPFDLVLDAGTVPPTFLGVPQSSWAILGVFAVYTVSMLSLTGGATLGHRLFGLQVWQVLPGAFFVRAVIRTALLCLIVPALIPTADGRGLHDYLAGTRIVRP